MTEAELYRLIPAEFVAARDAWARALAAGGERAEAARVRKLRRPSAALWATNQLAHADRPVLLAYVEAHERARDRHLRSLEDPRDPKRSRLARTATRQERLLLEDLVGRAEAHLTSSGLGARPAHLAQVKVNLRAAVIRPEVRERLLGGILPADQEEPGFSALAVPLAEQRPGWLLDPGSDPSS